MAHHADDLARRRRKLREPPAPHTGVDLEVDLHPLRDAAVRGHELEAGDASLADLAIRHRDP
jgi:hypothetical protein